MTAYTIKPLKWTEAKHAYAEAKTVMGWLYVRMSGGEMIWECPNSMTRGYCESVEDGKRKAESHYHSRLLPALVPVPDGAQVVDVHYNPNPEGRT